jgi:hypothetical protein
LSIFKTKTGPFFKFIEKKKKKKREEFNSGLNKSVEQGLNLSGS